MLGLLADRLCTPVFAKWVERDRVQLKDVRRAALMLNQKLQQRVFGLLRRTLIA